MRTSAYINVYKFFWFYHASYHIKHNHTLCSTYDHFEVTSMQKGGSTVIFHVQEAWILLLMIIEYHEKGLLYISGLNIQQLIMDIIPFFLWHGYNFDGIGASMWLSTPKFLKTLIHSDCGIVYFIFAYTWCSVNNHIILS